MKTLILGAMIGLTASLAHAQASATKYGPSCSVNFVNASIQWQGTPKLGSTFAIDYVGPNAAGGTYTAEPILNFGLSATSIPIPQILPQQPAKCFIHTLPVIAVTMPLDRTGTAYETRFDLKIPNNASLIGADLFAQYLCIYAQCGIVPPCPPVTAVLASEGLHMVLGL